MSQFQVIQHYGPNWAQGPRQKCHHCKYDPKKPTEFAQFRLYFMGEKHVDLCQAHFTEAALVMAKALEELG